jgi:xanthine dehydrogenase YagR molybdenum-binding subunit
MQTTPYSEFVEQAAAFSRTLYAAPNRRHEHRAVSLDLPPSDIMRAPGEEPGSIAMECGMDELAHALGMDPIDLRLKNEPQEDPENHLPFSSRSLVECLQEGAKRFGWEKRPKQPGTLRDGRFLIGYGVACATFPARSMRNAATVRMNADGSVIVKMSATDIGTGTFTILAQVTAQELDVPIDSVTVEIGDSQLPQAAGSGGSFGAASAAIAIHLACLKLRETLGDRDIRTLTDGIEASVEHKGSENPPKYSTHSFGAQFVEVAVDVDTAEIRVRRMLGVFACGRILNARTARSQLIGGMIMGLGAGLTEESILDTRDGSFVNHDIAEYHVPVNADVPAEIDAIFIPEHDDKANPLGIKGLGEVGIVGAGAAVANAVFNATGVRVREFPVTLDKVLAGLPPR